MTSLFELLDAIVEFMLHKCSDVWWKLLGTYLLNSKYQLKNKFQINGILTTRSNGNSEISSYSKFEGKKHNLTNLELTGGCRLGIDTHADTSCAGRHVRILEYIDGPTYNVAPFHDQYKPLEKIGMINGVVAVDTDEGKTYILELNNFLNFTNTMEHSLLCPMQARINGVEINDVPINLCSTIDKNN